MLILTIRTDKPEAELELYQDKQVINSLAWQAHRELSATIHSKIDQLLDGRKLNELEGIVAYRGPGSFTGLRIGLSVANALAAALKIPIVATVGQDWQQTGVQMLREGENQQVVVPEYGAPPKTTQQKK